MVFPDHTHLLFLTRVDMRSMVVAFSGHINSSRVKQNPVTLILLHTTSLQGEKWPCRLEAV